MSEADEILTELVSTGLSQRQTVLLAKLSAVLSRRQSGAERTKKWRENKTETVTKTCGERGGRLECDHVVPVSRGGSHNPDNLVTACFDCNRSKRDKLPSEWRVA